MKRGLLLSGLVWLAMVAPVFAQSKTVTALPFKVGEELVYEGEFSKLLLRGVNIVDLKFKVAAGPTTSKETGKELSKDHATEPASFRFVADAESKGALLKIFRQYFRQHLESTADAATLAALLTEKQDIQNKRERYSEAVFDYRKGVLTWTEHNPQAAGTPPRVVETPLAGTAYDLVSVWYYLRTVKNLTPGTTFYLPVSDSGGVYRIAVRVGERKTMKTVLGKVMTVRLIPEIFGNDKLIGGKGSLSLWLTDDARRIPVRGEINNNLGKLTVTLKKAQL